MEGINEAVVKQLKDQKGGKDVLPLWDKLWSVYQEDGPRGIDELLSQLMAPSSDSEQG